MLISLEDFPPELQITAFSLCPHINVVLCIPSLGISSSFKDTSPLGLRPHPMTSLYLNYLLKGLIFKYGHTLRLKASTYELEEDRIQAATWPKTAALAPTLIPIFQPKGGGK